MKNKWILPTICGAIFLVVPWAEFWLMINMGFTITFAIVWGGLTAGTGWWFRRGEQLNLWSELDSDLLNNRVPTVEGLDAMLIQLGGWGLIIPGLLTDTAGAALLVPQARTWLIPYLRVWIKDYLIEG